MTKEDATAASNALLDALNAYEGGNVWQDVILVSEGYDEAATDEIDRDGNNLVAMVDGTVAEYRPATRTRSTHTEAGWTRRDQ